jgi:hypothetical protein
VNIFLCIILGNQGFEPGAPPSSASLLEDHLEILLPLFLFYLNIFEKENFVVSGPSIPQITPLPFCASCQERTLST